MFIDLSSQEVVETLKPLYLEIGADVTYRAEFFRGLHIIAKERGMSKAMLQLVLRTTILAGTVIVSAGVLYGAVLAFNQFTLEYRQYGTQNADLGHGFEWTASALAFTGAGIVMANYLFGNSSVSMEDKYQRVKNIFQKHLDRCSIPAGRKAITWLAHETLPPIIKHCAYKNDKHPYLHIREGSNLPYQALPSL